MRIEPLEYEPEWRGLWKQKKLQKLWQKKYPQIFDQDDLRLTLSQNRYHFGEWVAAVHYAKLGYRVLVEKYLYPKTHRCKWEKAIMLLTAKQIEFLKHPRPRHQAPDLLVYKGNKLKFFAEVKLESDRLHVSQENCFKKIEKKFKSEIVICEVKKEKLLTFPIRAN